MASGQWPKFDCEALELMRSSDVLSSGLFNSLAWSRDELAVIALNIFLEVCVNQYNFKAESSSLAVLRRCPCQTEPCSAEGHSGGQMELDTTLRIPIASMKLFILSVRARMIDNNYHNWNHVVDVTQAPTHPPTPPTFAPTRFPLHASPTFPPPTPTPYWPPLVLPQARARYILSPPDPSASPTRTRYPRHATVSAAGLPRRQVVGRPLSSGIAAAVERMGLRRRRVTAA
jgi:hypothetical protein